MFKRKHSSNILVIHLQCIIELKLLLIDST